MDFAEESLYVGPVLAPLRTATLPQCLSQIALHAHSSFTIYRHVPAVPIVVIQFSTY